MNYKQHLAFSIATAVTVQYFTKDYFSFSFVNDVQFYAAAIVGSTLPDALDHPGSYIGRRTWGIFFSERTRDRIRKRTHRKLTHTILFCIGCYFLFFYLTHNPFLAFGGFVGVGSHLIGDMLTPDGIPLFYPFHYLFIFLKNTKLKFVYNILKKKYRIFPLIKSSS